jgi:ribosomal protein S18 acetylase RimI-like enzyme
MHQTPRFSIRRATSNDAAGILACLASAFEPYRRSYTSGAYSDTVLDSQTLNDRLRSMSVFVAVTESGEIAGTIACQRVSDDEGHLRGMAVLPHWQGHRIADQLLRAAEAELQDKCARITLDTTEPLQRAMKFYEKHGYRRSGRVTDFFGMTLFEYIKILQP